MVEKEDSRTDEWTQSDCLILAGHSLQAGGQNKNKLIKTRQQTRSVSKGGLTELLTCTVLFLVTNNMCDNLGVMQC